MFVNIRILQQINWNPTILSLLDWCPVFKFVEHPENNEKPMNQKSKVKFKIMCLKVKGPMDYVPELVNSNISLCLGTLIGDLFQMFKNLIHKFPIFESI